MQLWLKYRPTTLCDMVGLEALKVDAPSWSVAGTLRCGGVIFHGGPGTGKTSAAQAIAKDMLGETFDTNYHEFNASDERGIAFVRDRLKPLANQRPFGSDFRIICLDEGDGLTRDSQDTLRQIIEQTSSHNLWIITCNRVSRIIPALRSRLPSYVFSSLEGQEADNLIYRIIEEENYPVEWNSSVHALVKKNRGDLRACLKVLQLCNPAEPDSLIQNIQVDWDVTAELYGLVWDGKLTGDATIEQTKTTIKRGLTRDEIIAGLHSAMMRKYRTEGADSRPRILKHLLILGQWAARSPDWVADDLLFLQSLVGDFYSRG